MGLKKIYLSVRCIPKTIFFNFYYFDLKTAVKLPVLISHRVSLQSMNGKVKIRGPIESGMIHIGFHENRAFDQRRDRAVWHLEEGSIIFKGSAMIGNGTKLAVTGRMECGADFRISGNSQIICGNHMCFGEDVLIGYNNIFLDYDAHAIYDKETGNVINSPRPILIGNHVWIGANCKVLKGTNIKEHTMVGLGSLVNRAYEEENVILAGCPAKVIKRSVTLKKEKDA